MNVIVIVADSLRIDHLGCYGNAWIQTPHLDRFAQEAVVFDHYYPENLPTIPTRTSWWTGRYLFPFRGWRHLEHDDVLLSEVLWDQDYRTALITDVYHLHKPEIHFGRGFDEVYFVRGQEYDRYVPPGAVTVRLEDSPHHRLPETLPEDQKQLWRERYEQYLRNQTRIQGEEDTYIAQVVTAGLEWLDRQMNRRHGSKRFFLWLDCFDPHEPWDPPEPYASLYAKPGYTGLDLVDPVPGRVGETITEEELTRTLELYAGEVTLVDKWIGLFLDRCRELGLWENTLIVFTTDHGEPFGDHGIVRKCRPWLHEELVHSPLLLHLPEGTGAGTRCEALVQAPDLMPTILDFLGLPVPETCTGQSWLPLLRGEMEKLRDYAFMGMGRARAVYTQEWAYLLEVRGRGPERCPAQLYHRLSDPRQQKNVLAEHPEVARDLELALYRFREKLPFGFRHL
ncbi:MAG TPA: sulfatase [Armatimonadetes bacterium]|nr:sulfatase [Armatimonadota bacterium]